ncbi:MAG: CARDB domain-containing protein [Phototrophicales bacterium]|nr:CARDB domain-containing protein [Phototrophicales bacterium]
MMSRTKWIFILLIALLALPLAVSAQTILPNDDTVIDANANISFPPPIYTLRGQVRVFGSANVANMSNYFLEFRPVVNKPNVINNAAWTPASLPTTSPVTNNVLGTWDTSLMADGLYELRLTLNVRGQAATYFVVSPLRVENTPSNFISQNPQLVTSPTPLAVLPTTATNTPSATRSATATATIDANVRTGDDVAYQVVGFLLNGQSASILGVSSTGTGWYFIELSNGRRGFISPQLVTTSGSTAGLTRIDPPPFPVPPTATPIPVSGNLAASLPAITPENPTCNVPFQVLINITNNGTGNTQVSATVLFQDFHNGQLQSSFFRTIPPLAPGQNYVVGSDNWVIATNGGKPHELRVTIDPEGLVAEQIESDNVYSVVYTLQQGTCP